MDKISTQKFNVTVKKSDMSKADDVLGALFSMPMIADEKKVNGKIIDEFIVNPSIEKVLNSKKSSKSLGKLEIMYKEFFSGNSKKQASGLMFKNDQVFDFNSTKMPNVLSLDLKLNKLSKVNHVKNDGTKDLDLKINVSDENKKRLLRASEKNNLAISPHNNFVNKNNVKKSISNKNNLNDIFAKLDHLKEDIKSNNFENKIMFYDNEITYKQLKVNSETNSLASNSDQMNKVENLNLRNNFNQNQFNGDKNLNFVLDQMIEELDMSKLGWTEKLILRIEKGLKEAREIQTSQPGINFKGGYGWIAEKGWLIDNDSNLRQRKEQITNPNVKNQLYPRLTLTNANLIKGYFDVDIDSVIKPGNFTTEQRPCGPLSGVSTLDKTLTPMIPKLKKEVQNTNYIIPEDSQSDWLRGGLPTREMVRNKDYLRRYQQKTA